MKAGPERPSLAPYESYPMQELLKRTAGKLPNKIAIIDGQRRFTFKQFDDYSDRFAAALVGLGVSQHERVAILAPNCAEFEFAFYGIVKAGAVVTAINPGFRELEIAHQLNDSGARILVVHQDLLRLAESARDATPGVNRFVVIGQGNDGHDSFWDLIESAPAAPPQVVIDPKSDVAALPYSSGTTGLAKGVMLTHFNLTSNVAQRVRRTYEAATLLESDVLLIHPPLSHIYGMNVLMNGAIGAGATQVIMGQQGMFDMELFLSLLSKHKVTILYTVPAIGLGLVEYPRVSAFDLSSVRLAFIGAAPLSGEMQSEIQRATGMPTIQGYGVTETSPVLNSDFLEPHLTRPGSVGPAVPDTEEKVVDLETGEIEVSSGEVGELMVRGPQIMKGYFNESSATADTLTEDGWLRTGDIVRMDPDGWLWILDRKKEVIKYMGFQVPPAELEGLLMEHPAIMDAAVIGKRDSQAGEVPKAFVVLSPDAGVSGEGLMSFVNSRIATFKWIREVEFVDAIPRAPSGKILRRVLVERERAKEA